MHTARKSTARGTDAPDQANERHCGDGITSGTWTAQDASRVSVSWNLCQVNVHAAYHVTVNYCGEKVVDVMLDGTDQAGERTFTVRDPDGRCRQAIGLVRVVRRAGNDGDAGTRLDLLVELTNDPTQMNPPQRLASCAVADMPAKPIPGNTPVRVVDSTKAPACFVGQLSMDFVHHTTAETTTYIGTATVIAAPKGQTGLYLLTCAHNLYDSVDGSATRVSFIPALNGQDHPPAELEAEDWYVPDNYKHVASTHHADPALLSPQIAHLTTDYDYGLVKLMAKYSVSDAPTLFAASDDQLSEHTAVNLYGLYGWGGDTADMYHGKGALDKSMLATYPNLLYYGVSTEKGASGTAVMWKEEKVVGVHDRKAPKDVAFNIGHRITKETLVQLQKWMGAGA